MFKRRRNKIRWAQRRAFLDAERNARAFTDCCWNLLREPLYKKYLAAAWHQGRATGPYSGPALFEVAKTLAREYWNGVDGVVSLEEFDRLATEDAAA